MLNSLEKIQGEAIYSHNQTACELAPWSVSKAKVASSCGLQFQWKYVDKKEQDVLLETDDQSSRIGTALHAIYEDIISGRDQQQAVQRALCEQSISMTEKETVDDLLMGVSWFTEQLTNFIFQRVSGNKPFLIAELVRDCKIGVEKRFALDKELRPIINTKGAPDFYNDTNLCFLRGVIDLQMFTIDGGAVVIDHKSSKFSGNMHIYAEQLRTYAIALLQSYPHLQWVQCGIHFMPLKELKWNDVVTRQTLPSEMRALYYYLNNAINNAIDTQLQIGNHCKWCSYRESCKSLRKERRAVAKKLV